MKIMIVDDEVIIREGLSTVIDWKQLGFQFLEPAESAEEALERIPVEKPDLLLTDIRMEEMDGLTLAKEAKAMFPDLEIIMLSGYDDFSYMQQAIRNDVSDYLLKTSRPGDIIQAVLRAAQRIRSKWNSNSKVYHKEKEMRKHWFEKILAGDGGADKQVMGEYFPLFKDSDNVGKRSCYQVVLIKAEGWGNADGSGLLLQFAVENMLREIVSCETLAGKRYLVAVMKYDEGSKEKECYCELFPEIERLLKCTLYCASGPSVGTIEELSLSYHKALQTAKYWEIFMQERILSYERIGERKGWRTVSSRQEEAELSQLLLANDSIRLNQWIGTRVSEHFEHPEVTYESYSSYIQSLALSGFRWLERMAAELEALKEGIADYSSFGEKGDVALRDKLQQYLETIMNAYHLNVSKGPAVYVQQAIAYIQQNIGNQKLSLHEAARYVHLHPGHFSEVFKRVTGTTFGDYLIQEKLELAKEMLIDPSVKISEIARSVGYEDVKYFSQQFKRYYSQTPSEYRDELFGK
ncbi:response regulator transcription factor [Paenibacillus radicis (ex Xue et al. 2023)]|uniref:Response regulator n=1 Tax=Paenibacillus radicis (ex Xue et al. 2023) TaxID=2972489 RepID=A0ABT1YDB0_9BACL|nr:response regulator [Paenibacillus radicis (ex Xue et al. 2023)]MCR8630912.1 response regulator [Paenibacillus radicis (ex Xue et al. 2023)]